MCMNNVNMIKDIWHELEEAHVTGVIKRALDIPSSLKMFCTYKRPDGYCGIAFSFSQEITLDISHFQNLSEIEVSLFKDSSYPDSMFLLIQLYNKDSRVRDIFAAICENIAKTIQAIPSERKAVKLVISQMRKWQDLFSKRIKNLLSIQEQQGLFGELTFLLKLINSSMDNVFSVESWEGPQKSPQDFKSDKWAVEVKTITNNKFPNVSINGELQLDETSFEKLYLYNLVVVIKPTEGKNLPELIHDLRNRLSSDIDALNIFENKLIYYGYYDTDADVYAERHYNKNKENYYLVQGDFPRIKKDDLLLGVSDVKYTIALAVPNENVIPEKTVLNTILTYERNK